MTKAVIYARYSSDLQREASIEDQIRMATQYAQREGLEIVNTYSDHAISGASMNRAGLLQMLDDANDGQFTTVITEGLDRISRDQEHVAGIYKRLNFAGVKIYSLSDGGEISDLHVGLKGTMNALFLKDLAVKTKRGLIGRIESGKLVGKNTFGYDVVRRFDANGEPVRGERTINPEQAAIVKRIFEEFAAGRSARQIAKSLNEENQISPKGNGWSDWAINGSSKTAIGTLNQEIYIGRVIWNKNSFIKNPATGKRVRRPNPKEQWVINEIPELRIIDQELWDKVKEQQAKRQRKIPLNQKRRPIYLLSYLLKCGCCEGGLAMVSNKRYGCTNAYSKGACDNRITIARDKLEGMVLKALQSQLMKPELFTAFCEEYQKHIDTLALSQKDTIKAAKAKLARLEKEKSNMVEAIKAGMLAAEFKDAMTDNATEREKAQNYLDSITENPAILTPDMAKNFKQEITALCGKIENPKSRDEAINIIRKMIDKVVLSPDRKNKKLKVDLYGNLAEMLAVANHAQDPKSQTFNIDAITANPAQSLLSTATDLHL